MFAPFRRPLRLLRPYRRELAIGALCPPLFAGLGLAVTARLGHAIDALRHVGDGGSFDLSRACVILVALGAAIAVLRFLARHLLVQVSRNLERDLKNSLVAHLQRLPLAYFDRAGTGDLVSRMTQDVEVVRFMFGPALLYGASALVVVPGALTMMVLLSPLLTAAIGLAFVLLLASSRRLMPRLQAASKRVQEAIGQISDRALEDFVGIRVLLTFARAKDENVRLGELSQHYLEENVRLTRLRALYNLAIHVSTDCVTLAVLVVGGYEVLRGHLTTGELFQFLLLLGLVTWPLIAIGWILATYPRAKAAMARIEEIFAQEPEPGARVPAAAEPIAPLRGDVEVRGLTFTYPGRTTPALRDVSFRLDAGQRLGLVGPVGCGKSTIVALLLRLYEPPAGTIFVDGHDVLALDPRALRRTFAVAPQDPFLFSDSIEANVRFGAGDAASEARVLAAVHTSALEQDLPDLRDGLRTVVGERGVTLSGGQKQRVSLARALGADRPTLVLDDTLSAVDHATERRILDRLRDAGAGRTTIVTSHRLSAVIEADVVLVLDDGKVVQRGNHRTLLAQPGAYARYYRLQTEADALETFGDDAGEGADGGRPR